MEWNEKSRQSLEWGEISHYELKMKAARELAKRVQNGDVIGFGSGSTSLLTVKEIGRRVKEEGLSITAIPTSQEMELMCGQLMIPVCTLLQKRPDWCFDGADEVDPHRWLIKGRGGAMFREKMVMSAASERYIVIDPSKRVAKLGEKFSIPVECQYEALHYVRDALQSLGADKIVLRPAIGKDGPCITEFGHFILDAHFADVQEELEHELKQIVGVVETGLFIGFDPQILCVE